LHSNAKILGARRPEPRRGLFRFLSAMAQFYLNVRAGDELIRNPRAYQFPTAQAARDATVKAVRDMLRERPDDFANKQIEIADETGHAISVVHVHDVMPVH
jgi:hypothetical protein